MKLREALEKGTDVDPMTIRRRVLDASDDDLTTVATEVRAALESDSNDADHDALVNVAELLGIHYDPEGD